MDGNGFNPRFVFSTIHWQLNFLYVQTKKILRTFLEKKYGGFWKSGLVMEI